MKKFSKVANIHVYQSVRNLQQQKTWRLLSRNYEEKKTKSHLEEKVHVWRCDITFMSCCSVKLLYYKKEKNGEKPWRRKWENILHTFERLVVSLGEEEHGFCCPFGSLEKAVALRIFSEGGQQVGVGLCHAGNHVFSGQWPMVQLAVKVEHALFVPYIKTI